MQAKSDKVHVTNWRKSRIQFLSRKEHKLFVLWFQIQRLSKAPSSPTENFPSFFSLSSFVHDAFAPVVSSKPSASLSCLFFYQLLLQGTNSRRSLQPQLHSHPSVIRTSKSAGLFRASDRTATESRMLRSFCSVSEDRWKALRAIRKLAIKVRSSMIWAAWDSDSKLLSWVLCVR